MSFPGSVFPRPHQVEFQPGSVRVGAFQVQMGPFDRAHAALTETSLGASGVPVGWQIDAEYAAEGYRLLIEPTGITIAASADAGAFYAVQTLRQMLPLDPHEWAEFELPCMRIEDEPRFRWRGMMLDVSRHFFPVNEIKSLLDWLAAHKLNVFHWHLTDDGGWRMESRAFPQLTSIGAWRKFRPEGWDYFDIEFPGPSTDARLYGGFYTQEEIREVVQYASDRHITVVPEIDVPGHALAVCASYPLLTCSDDAVQQFVANTRMNAPNVLCIGQESTYEFLETLLDEVMELFPSRVIHLGGDEVDHTLWQHCEHCQAKVRDLELPSLQALHGYFVRRMATYLESHGRVLMGWDEIVETGLSPSAMVMSWRGFEGGRAAAAQGHDVVMTPTKHCYFDYSYDVLPAAVAGAFDPLDGIPEPFEHHVRGGQANLWTEYVPTWNDVEQRTFPRLAPLAEALWTGPKPSADLEERLAAYCERLEAQGIAYQGSVRAGKASYQEGVLYLNR